jgi:hypothetical protein
VHQGIRRAAALVRGAMIYPVTIDDGEIPHRRTFGGGGRVLPALLAVLALGSGCAAPSDGGGSASSGGSGNAAGGGTTLADDDLLVRIDRGDGSPAEEWTLSCLDVVAGTHPEAVAACAHLSGLDDPFAPLPADVVCTEQYGGPQTARVTGRWHGEPVDAELSRVDGCRIAQWDGLGPLLPVDVGVEPVG